LSGRQPLRKPRLGQRALAGLAVVSAGLTGGLIGGLGGPGLVQLGAVSYLLVTGVALITPAAITVQVVWGLTLLGNLLVGPAGANPLLLIPAITGIIFTAEILAIVARMDTPFHNDPRDDLPRAIVSALIGGAVFGAVSLLSGFRGPTGFVAVVLASGACVLLAILLVRDWSSPNGVEEG
jgi:hypothetical protein